MRVELSAHDRRLPGPPPGNPHPSLGRRQGQGLPRQGRAGALPWVGPAGQAGQGTGVWAGGACWAQHRGHGMAGHRSRPGGLPGTQGEYPHPAHFDRTVMRLPAYACSHFPVFSQTRS